MIFSRDLGIDLGTSNTRICDRKGRIIINEHSVVAVDVKSKRVVATGNEAKNMIGRTPGSIVAVRPLNYGVIADFDMTSDMLRNFIHSSSKRSLFTRTRVVISIPNYVTEVERRAVEDAVRSAGAQDVELIEESMAAALGTGLPVYDATGSMVVNIGAGTCDVAVISLGGIASCQSIKVGGDAFDQAIIDYMRDERELLIGVNTAEDIKLKLGSAKTYEGEAAMEIKGRNLSNGLPKSIEITSKEVQNILEEPVNEIINTVKSTLEATLPELAADIIDRGIYLTGGGCQLKGLKELIASETGITVHVPDDPTSCVAVGTSIKLRRVM